MSARLRCALAALALIGAASAAAAADGDYDLTSVDTAREQLVLFLDGADGQPFRAFARLREALAARGKTLQFAMNAGMYEADGRPVGLLVIDGRERAPLNLQRGAGNFYLQPNGVFALTREGPKVVTTAAYPSIAPTVLQATQSGPMLVVDGAINPAFSPTSTARHVRNGVCVHGKVVHLAISRTKVTFHEFATYFRDVLGCRDALYLDGAISSVYHRDGASMGPGTDLGPMLGVVR